MQIIIYVLNKLLLELHQIYWLPDLSAPWYFAIRLNERNGLFTIGHLCVTLPIIIITDWY